jgi:pimeloyl-ACP methyl ester carboxylesterase
VAERRLLAPGVVEALFKGQPRIKGAYDDEDIAAYREAWNQPGAMTAMLNWYRAAMRGMRSGPRLEGTVRAPTLVLWGMDDEALPPGNLEGLERYVDDLEIVRVPNCSHWITHDAPGLVNDRLVRFLAPARARAAHAAQ